jgi:hypothetical protein
MSKNPDFFSYFDQIFFLFNLEIMLDTAATPFENKNTLLHYLHKTRLHGFPC